MSSASATRDRRGVRRTASRLLLMPLAALLLGAWCVDSTDRVSVMALANTGQLDAAEATARAGGDSLLTTLGDVLVLRGRLSAADSVYQRAVAAQAPLTRLAEVGQAELLAKRGAFDQSFVRAQRIIANYEASGTPWSAEEQVAAGRAYVLLALRDSRFARSALAAFDAAWLADASLLDARVRAGDLLLEKYNAPDAKSSYEDVLKLQPDHARALLGMARVQEFEGSAEAMATVAKALSTNPSLAAAQTMRARLFLEAESYDSASAAVSRALASDSSNLDAWALRAAAAWFTGDSATFRSSEQAARSINSKPAAFFSSLAESAVRHRRYADGVRWAKAAVDADGYSVRALGILGTNQLRTGAMADGRATLERAFSIDPFNLWHKNTLDLLDEMNGFTTISRPRFELVVSPEDAALMELYLLPLLEEAYDSLTTRYKWTPNRPVRLEVFRRHADFSVRSVGLTGLGALGVSFGDVLAMDSPSAREAGSFNWGSTAWHELAHTFTLGSSLNRVPRWLSEGLSVLEERRARPSWGARASVDFLAAYKAGQLRPVSSLNDGFVRPRFPSEVQFSYFLASMVCEMLERDFGAATFPALMKAYAEGLETPAAFERVLRISSDSLDRQFAAFMSQRFAKSLAGVAAGEGPGDVRGPFVDAMREGAGHLQAKREREAAASFTKAQTLLDQPDFPGGPTWYLAQIALTQNDTAAAIVQLSRITASQETALEANTLLASLQAAQGNHAGVVQTLQSVIWMAPYDAALHTQLAEAATALSDHALAVRERRAALAIGPADPLEARYQLALALSNAGDKTGARREVLGILENAPSFEKAQSLLLSLRQQPSPRRMQ